jgi:hypothetical protein
MYIENDGNRISRKAFLDPYCPINGPYLKHTVFLLVLTLDKK